MKKDEVLEVPVNHSVALSQWEKFYWEVHGTKVNFNGIPIPKKNDSNYDSYGWLLCRPGNFSPERIYSGGKLMYPKEKLSDKSLDNILDFSYGRDGCLSKPYIMRFLAIWEASEDKDESLKNLSAIKIAEMQNDTACLAEILLLHDFMWWSCKRHLDTKSIALCNSRFKEFSEDMPGVICGHSGMLEIGKYWPGNTGGNLQFRRIILRQFLA